MGQQKIGVSLSGGIYICRSKTCDMCTHRFVCFTTREDEVMIITDPEPELPRMTAEEFAGFSLEIHNSIHRAKAQVQGHLFIESYRGANDELYKRSNM